MDDFIDDLSPDELEALHKLQNPDADSSEVDRYNWNDDFQSYLIGLLVCEKSFLVQCVNLVKPSYFAKEPHRIICKTLFEYFEKYKSIPTQRIFMQQIKDAVESTTPELQWETLACTQEVYDFYVSGLDDREYLLDKITYFAKNAAFKEAIKVSLRELKFDQGETAWAKIRDRVQTALQVDRNFDIGLLYFQTVDERYIRKAEKVALGEAFSSGFEAIDESLVSGGLKRGEMYSWMALPGVGKSLALTTGAIKNISQGKKVLVISLEMDEDSVADRFDAQLARVNINQLMIKQDQVKDAIHKEIADMQAEEVDSLSLIIKQFPGGTVDVNMVRGYLNQVKIYGFHPDILVLDYVGEMKDHPNLPTHESRPRMVRDLRGLAVEENILILTAMQPNKEAREAQKSNVIDDTNLAEAFGQSRPLDGCWSINQHQEEKEAGVGRIFVIKHRHGKSRFQFHVEFDPETLQIRQISKESYTTRMKVHMNNKKINSVDLDKELRDGRPGKSKKFFKNNSNDDEDFPTE